MSKIFYNGKVEMSFEEYFNLIREKNTLVQEYAVLSDRKTDIEIELLDMHRESNRQQQHISELEQQIISLKKLKTKK